MTTISHLEFDELILSLRYWKRSISPIISTRNMRNSWVLILFMPLPATMSRKHFATAIMTIQLNIVAAKKSTGLNFMSSVVTFSMNASISVESISTMLDVIMYMAS